MRLVLLISLCFSFSIGLSACGYTLHTTQSRSPVLEAHGIRRVYISAITNNSYKAGAEIVVYNALVKKISSQGEIKVVNHVTDADAVLIGEVVSADYSISASTAGSSLEPKDLSSGFKKYTVASVYNASLNCSFTLKATERARMESKKDRQWTATYNRSKSFQASNSFGALGTTSAIINDSEFDRAISDLADSMMIDVHESLLGMF